MDNSEDKWTKLETVLRKVLREELESLEKRILEGTGLQISQIGKKQQVAFHGGKWTGITAEQKAAWAAAYPSVDLESELLRAGAWISSNPHMAPKSQFARFLNHWLSKSHMTLSIRSIPTRNEPVLNRKLCAYCEKVASSMVGGIWHCDGHTYDAMDKKPIPHMRGVLAKPVAGRD